MTQVSSSNHGVPLPKVHVWPRYRIFKPIRLLKKSSHEYQPHLPPSTLATPNDSSRDTGAPSLPGRGVHCDTPGFVIKMGVELTKNEGLDRLDNENMGIWPANIFFIALVRKPRLSLSHASVLHSQIADHGSVVYFSDVPIVSIIPSCHQLPLKRLGSDG